MAPKRNLTDVGSVNTASVTETWPREPGWVSERVDGCDTAYLPFHKVSEILTKDFYKKLKSHGIRGKVSLRINQGLEEVRANSHSCRGKRSMWSAQGSAAGSALLSVFMSDLLRG